MKHSSVIKSDVAIIGAGPSGALAAAFLRQYGYQVLVLEKQHFPRFSIGESLLPQCMEFIEQAGMLDAVKAASFQSKNGAAFHCAGKDAEFDFSEKFTSGWGTTFQVQRSRFDHILATEAERKGADIRYGHEISAVDFSGAEPRLEVTTDEGESLEVRARFVLDASGFGRVLPRLLNLERPSDFPVRQSVFTHIEDRIDEVTFDREKILITVHPQHRDVWFWLIPFSDGRSSVGVVAKPEFFKDYQGSPSEQLQTIVSEDDHLNSVLGHCRWDTPARAISGYSCNVASLWGPGYALLGNAAEFLDPVFSSGVTIAMKSARLATQVLHQQLQGRAVDWDTDFAVPLKQGVDTFRTYVEAWYDGTFQDVIFAENPSGSIRRMISAILAGYAWDTRNPFVKQSRRRLNVLAETCRQYDRKE